MFNPQRCYLNIWCGKNPKPDQYRRIGSPYECLRKGFGIGKFDKPHAPRSLDSIPYITDEKKAVLHRLQITTLFNFLTHVNNLPDYRSSKRFIEGELALTNAEHYNKMILFLYEKGIPIIKLPRCK
jgi:hypothetical protein